MSVIERAVAPAPRSPGPPAPSLPAPRRELEAVPGLQEGRSAQNLAGLGDRGRAGLGDWGGPGFSNRDLAGLGDRELLALAGARPASKARAGARELLVHRYSHLVRACVRRYSRSLEPAEDLMQVGYVGLLKAIDNFDPGGAGGLAAFARPYISGEIKRHFRDKRWPVRVPRPVQELVLEIRAQAGQLAQNLGRDPVDADFALHLGVSRDAVREARRAELAFQPGSLDAPLGRDPGSPTLADVLGTEDPRLEHVLSMQAVAVHWRELPVREQKILVMRYYDDMTQAQIGRELGISQMHVSRLTARALSHLRTRLLSQHAPAPGTRLAPPDLLTAQPVGCGA